MKTLSEYIQFISHSSSIWILPLSWFFSSHVFVRVVVLVLAHVFYLVHLTMIKWIDIHHDIDLMLPMTTLANIFALDLENARSSPKQFVVNTNKWI